MARAERIFDTLTPKQQRWVEHMVTTGGNPTDAARKAGYGDDAPDAKSSMNRCTQAGYANSHNPRVQECIRQEAGAALYTGALIGARVLLEIASDPGHKDRLKAANKLLEHNGYQIIDKSETRHIHEVADDKELIAKIVTMANGLGIDPHVLLGQQGIVLDAEFKVIEDKRVPVGSTEGLEDLLA